jgi:hypothetical protein
VATVQRRGGLRTPFEGHGKRISPENASNEGDDGRNSSDTVALGAASGRVGEVTPMCGARKGGCSARRCGVALATTRRPRRWLRAASAVVAGGLELDGNGGWAVVRPAQELGVEECGDEDKGGSGGRYGAVELSLGPDSGSTTAWTGGGDCGERLQQLGLTERRGGGCRQCRPGTPLRPSAAVTHAEPRVIFLRMCAFSVPADYGNKCEKSTCTTYLSPRQRNPTFSSLARLPYFQAAQHLSIRLRRLLGGSYKLYMIPDRVCMYELSVTHLIALDHATLFRWPATLSCVPLLQILSDCLGKLRYYHVSYSSGHHPMVLHRP